MAVASRSQALVDIGSARLFRRGEELLAKCDVDIVFILGSLDQHMKIARLALQKSCDIFLTKPITPTLKDALMLKSLALKKRAQIFVDHTFLFNPDFLKFKNLASNEKIKSIASHRVQFGRFQKGSDVLGELLYHDIYMSLALMNSKPLNVRSIGSKTHDDSLDQCSLQMNFKSQATVELFGSMNFIQKQKIMSVMTANKILAWQDMAPSVFTESKYKFGYGQESRLGPVKIQKSFGPAKGKDALERMLEHVAGCKRTGKKSRLIGIDQGIEIMRIIEAARKSVRSGRQVSL